MEEWIKLFLMVTTIGPPQYRLNSDVNQLIVAFAAEPVDVSHRIVCHICNRLLLYEENGVYRQSMTYFLITDDYCCADCAGRVD